ncbi:hypothetical protein RJ639_033495 [Escallonia herrerae]|uniref:Reverse transcriptase Ty1/copia-type domain-containing protein n=1 Tax=Escallonia herrerae TaxID=1293975 RepID=A0AA88WU54_9ASTE|nr:hypothetical protein RJ639_033495 [Escallonia herrerae]
MQWTVAISEEIKSLYKNQMLELVKPLVGQKIVGCKWVYEKNGRIPKMKDARYKARLVAKGFTQREGIDYNKIFSPVVKHTSIRALLAMVALYDLELKQLDVKKAFLYDIHEGFVIQDKEDHVCLLKKSNLQGSGIKLFNTFMTERGHTKSAYDSCVSHQRLVDGSHIYLMLYVDDMFNIAAKMMSDIKGLKEHLKREFEIKD